MSDEPEDAVRIPESLQAPLSKGELTLRYRFILIGAAWAAALLLTSPNPLGIVFLPLFPLGLARLFPESESGSPAFIAAGWGAYWLLFFIAIACSKRPWFYALYAIS